MKCIHTVRINQHVRKPLHRFLATFPVLRMLAAEAEVSPVEYVADHFLPHVYPSETYEAWLCRQVKDILETGLLHDDAKTDTTERVTATLHQKVIRVELDESDRAYLLEAFGGNPGLRLMFNMLTRKGETSVAA